MDEQEHLNGLAEDPDSPEQDEKAELPEDVSVFRNAWEISAAARRKEELAERERQKREAEEQYQEREKYAKELAEEKVDLLRLKQGVITEDEMGFPEEEEKHYTVWQKIGNWFYHAKWWLGIAVFSVVLVGFLVYDYFMRTDPDLCVMILCDNTDLSISVEKLCKWIEPVCPDFNEDGEVLVQAAYIPVSEHNMEHGGNYSTAYNSQLLLQFQSATCMLVIADSGSDPYLKPAEMFSDLTELYPDCPFVDGVRLNLNDTNLLEQADISGELNPGCYLALRNALENMNTLEQNQEARDRAKQVLDEIVPMLHAKTTEKEQSNG